jgi:DNA-binding MarR family transcriptional regulator
MLPSLVGYNLRKAQLVVFNDFARTMGSTQITPGQFGVLMLISGNPGLTQSALAQAIGIERSTMVAVIDALESKNLIKRNPSPVDRRSNALLLSDEGVNQIESLKTMVSAHEDRILTKLTRDERVQLIALLGKISDK